MRERFDFSGISAIILENSKQDNFKKEYFYLLFDYAFTQDEIKISLTDESNISRILNGERSVPKDIVSIYQTTDHKEHLKEGVSKVLEEVFDVAAVVRQIYDLLMGDVTLSMSMRNELAKDKEDSLLFLTNCILAGMMRNSVKKNKEGRQLDFDDYLLNYHYPKSNKAFFGRDKELDNIHKILSQETCVFLHGIGGIGKSKLAIHYGSIFGKEY